MERTPLDNVIVIYSAFLSQCSRRDQIRQTKITKYFLISKYIKYTSSGLDGGGSAEAEPRPWGLLGIERVDGSGYCESLVELEKTIKIEVELRDGDRNEGKELLDQG